MKRPRFIFVLSGLLICANGGGTSFRSDPNSAELKSKEILYDFQSFQDSAWGKATWFNGPPFESYFDTSRVQIDRDTLKLEAGYSPKMIGGNEVLYSSGEVFHHEKTGFGCFEASLKPAKKEG